MKAKVIMITSAGREIKYYGAVLHCDQERLRIHDDKTGSIVDIDRHKASNIVFELAEGESAPAL